MFKNFQTHSFHIWGWLNKICFCRSCFKKKGGGGRKTSHTFEGCFWNHHNEICGSCIILSWVCHIWAWYNFVLGHIWHLSIVSFCVGPYLSIVSFCVWCLQTKSDFPCDMLERYIHTFIMCRFWEGSWQVITFIKLNTTFWNSRALAQLLSPPLISARWRVRAACVTYQSKKKKIPHFEMFPHSYWYPLISLSYQ